MHIPFVPDGLLVLCRLLGSKQRIVTALAECIMLQPGGVFTLADVKVGGVLFASGGRLKGIGPLVFIVNAVQIQEVGNLYFLNGAQEFTGQGFDSLGALLLHLLHILAQTALKGFIVLSSFIKMVLVHVIELENIFLKVEIVTKEQNQVAHEFLVAENRFLQHFEDDLIRGEVDFRRLHRELLDDIKSKLMECANLCRDFETLIDALLQFANGFAGVRNDDDFFGMDALLLHQVFHLGGHGGGFTRTGTCYQQAVVIISNDRTALLFI